MEKDIDKIINRLLSLSGLIIDEFYALAELSYRDMEETNQFASSIEDVKRYLNNEAVILNNLDLITLKEIFIALPKYDDNTEVYERTHINIDNKIADYILNDDNYEDIEFDPENEDDDFVLEDTEKEIFSVQKYYIDEEGNEKYEAEIIDNIALIVLKRLYKRINDTDTDNRCDNKFKKRLLRNLKSFKYFVFGLDLNMEKTGVNYRFNIDDIPLIPMPNTDISKICYNQCITILDKLYSVNNNECDVDTISEALFDMMCLEEYIKYLDDEYINKLIQLCNELNNIIKDSFYGNIAIRKLTKKY